MNVISESFSNRKVELRTYTITLSDRAVEKMVESSPGKPIYYNYNHLEKVGHVTGVLLNDGVVSVVCEIDDKYISENDQFVCPAFTLTEDLWCSVQWGRVDRVCTDATVECFGLIENPVEKWLKPMEIKP